MSAVLRKIIQALSVFALAALTTISARAEQVYSFGVVPQFLPNKIIEIWEPVLTEVSRRSGVELQLAGAQDIPTFEETFGIGSYDFAFMNPYHFTTAQSLKGYIALVNDNGRKLRGVVVVAKNSPIQNLSDLNGEKVSFPSPNALGASLLVRAELEQIHNSFVKPVYRETHTFSYLAALVGETAAAGGVLSTLKAQKKQVQDGLRVIYETTGVPPHPIAAHPRVPEDVRERVKQAFLGLGQTEDGKAMLAKIPMREIGLVESETFDGLRSMNLDDYAE